MATMLSDAQRRRQTRIGLALAGTIILAFVALQVWSVFVLRLAGWNWVLAVPLVAVLSWLSVGCSSSRTTPCTAALRPDAAA
jgi:beta-carotene ketolase (CrtW type)